jgi:hypothetical protein
MKVTAIAVGIPDKMAFEGITHVGKKTAIVAASILPSGSLSMICLEDNKLG